MKCSFCGTENPETASFCGQCGGEIVNQELLQVETSVKEEKRKKTKVAIVLFGCILLIAVGVAGWLVFQKNQVKKYNESVEAAYKYLEEQDYEKAEASFLTALKIEPKEIELYQGLANVYTETEEIEKLEETYEGVLGIIEDNYKKEEILSDVEEEMYFDAIVFMQDAEEKDKIFEMIEFLYTKTDNEDILDRLNELEIFMARYPAFIELIEEYMEKYGAFTKEGSYGEMYSTGLSLVKLVDFNCDGAEELVLGYDTQTSEWHDYIVEVWDYVDGKLAKVYEGEPYLSEGGEWAIIYAREGLASYMETGSWGVFKTGDMEWIDTYDYYGYHGENFTKDYAYAYDTLNNVNYCNDQIISEYEWDEMGPDWRLYKVLEYCLGGLDVTSVEGTLEQSKVEYEELVKIVNQYSGIDKLVEKKDYIEVIVEWDGKIDGEKLFNLNPVLGSPVEAGRWYAQTLFDENGKKDTTIKATITDEKGLYIYRLYNTNATCSLTGDDGDFSPDNWVNNMFSIDGKATVILPDGSSYVFYSDDGVVRSFTGYRFWGICEIIDGEVYDYDTSWIDEVYEEQGLRYW